MTGWVGSGSCPGRASPYDLNPQSIPQLSRPRRLIIELPGDALIRGITWTADGRSVIVGQERAGSDIVLFDQGGETIETLSRRSVRDYFDRIR